MRTIGTNAVLPPERLAHGSVIPTFSIWAGEWLDATLIDPDGFWLKQTRDLVVWREKPTVGLEGDFHSAEHAPLRWFSDGRLNVTETSAWISTSDLVPTRSRSSGKRTSRMTATRLLTGSFTRRSVRRRTCYVSSVSIGAIGS
jgi:hypothetical protein